MSGIDSAPLEEFEEIDGANPELSFRTAAALQVAPFAICHEGHYATARKTLRDDVYLDYCARHDIPFGCQSVVALDEAGFVGLATLRTQAEGVSTVAQRRRFARLVPHVRGAIELQRAVEGQGKQLLLGSFDAIDKCALLVDRSARCLGLTAAAA